MTMYLILLYSVIFSNINENQIIEDYKNANTIITGKLIDIREVKGSGHFCEFEAIQVFKGKSYLTYLISTNNIDMIKGETCLLYLQKTNKRYSIIHYKTQKDKLVNSEIEFLYKYVNKKLFRSVKNPSTDFKYIDSHC